MNKEYRLRRAGGEVARAALPALLLCCLGGCGARYSCGVPEGQPCRSLAQIYEALSGEWDGDRGGVSRVSRTGGRAATRRFVPAPRQELIEPAGEHVRVLEVRPGAPLLTRARQLRLWVRGWEDSAGDLHSESFLYLRLEEGHWRVPRPGAAAQAAPEEEVP